MAQNDEPLEEEMEEPVPQEPQQEPAPEPQPQPKRFNAGEPVYLYVKTSATTYDNVGEFPSRVDASRAAEESWKGHQYKTLTASEAVAEQQRLQARQERVKKVTEKVEKGASKLGSGLIRVAKNVAKRAEGEAVSRGMIHDYPSRPAPSAQSVNVNVNTGEKGETVNNLRRMDEHIRGRQPEPEPTQQKQYMIQKPVSKFLFNPPESPIKPLKHKLNPPPSMIKPSKHTLEPPTPSQKQYGVIQRHGGFMFSDSVRPYRIPVYSRFRQPEKQPVKAKRHNHKNKRRKK